MAKLELLDLRPCQFVLGMREVEGRIEKMQSLSKPMLRKYLDDRPIPLVRGPKKQFFLIDHHHLVRACWELKIKHYSLHVIEDMSDLSETEFWNKMIRRDWTYLHDQFGLGPHTPSALPVDIRCLADDPYRSLVWEIISRGGIEKEKIPFFEFKWAAFFRHNVTTKLHSKSDFSHAIETSMNLATSKHADHLPGFVGKVKKNSSKKAK